MRDPTTPLSYHICNLLLSIAADDNWYPAERCQLEAERIFARVYSTDRAEEAAIKDLRKCLDGTERSQAKDAPEVVNEASDAAWLG